MGDLYNPAQLEVLRRAHAIATPGSEADSQFEDGSAPSRVMTDGGST
jgi:hypothetical protein